MDGVDSVDDVDEVDEVDEGPLATRCPCKGPEPAGAAPEPTN